MRRVGVVERFRGNLPSKALGRGRCGHPVAPLHLRAVPKKRGAAGGWWRERLFVSPPSHVTGGRFARADHAAHTRSLSVSLFLCTDTHACTLTLDTRRWVACGKAAVEVAAGAAAAPAPEAGRQGGGRADNDGAPPALTLTSRSRTAPRRGVMGGVATPSSPPLRPTCACAWSAPSPGQGGSGNGGGAATVGASLILATLVTAAHGTSRAAWNSACRRRRSSSSAASSRARRRFMVVVEGLRE